MESDPDKLMSVTTAAKAGRGEQLDETGELLESASRSGSKSSVSQLPEPVIIKRK